MSMDARAPAHCIACGEGIPASAKFCRSCGSPQVTGSATSSKQSPPPRPKITEGEVALTKAQHKARARKAAALIALACYACCLLPPVISWGFGLVTLGAGTLWGTMLFLPLLGWWSVETAAKDAGGMNSTANLRRDIVRSIMTTLVSLLAFNLVILYGWYNPVKQSVVTRSLEPYPDVPINGSQADLNRYQRKFDTVVAHNKASLERSGAESVAVLNAPIAAMRAGSILLAIGVPLIFFLKRRRP